MNIKYDKCEGCPFLIEIDKGYKKVKVCHISKEPNKCDKLK